MRVCRAFFRCENEAESNLLADLLLTDQHRVPTSIPFFGSWGRLNSKSILPFVLRDERIDFGDEVSDDTTTDHSSRLASFDIVGVTVAVGDLYDLTNCRKTYLMRLERLTDLDRLAD